ncbi:MAG: DedA family protein, partial [Caulobacteraceae bacterium]
GLAIILIKGFTPVPFKLVTIASGLAAFSFPLFVAAAAVTRGARFFLVAGVVKRFGPAVLPAIERRLGLAALAVVALVVAALVIVHFAGLGLGCRP